MIYLLSEIRDAIEKIFKAPTASDSEILHIQTQESLDGYKEFDQQLNDTKVVMIKFMKFDFHTLHKMFQCNKPFFINIHFIWHSL